MAGCDESQLSVTKSWISMTYRRKHASIHLYCVQCTYCSKKSVQNNWKKELKETSVLQRFLSSFHGAALPVIKVSNQKIIPIIYFQNFTQSKSFVNKETYSRKEKRKAGLHPLHYIISSHSFLLPISALTPGSLYHTHTSWHTANHRPPPVLWGALQLILGSRLIWQTRQK